MILAAALLLAAVVLWPGGPGPRSRAVQALLPARGPRRPVPAVEIASVMELLALALRSGAGVVAALEAVARRCPDITGDHLATVAAAQRWGVPEDEAWDAVPGAWEPVRRALGLAARAGAPPADILLRAAQDLRAAERHRLAEATAKLSVTVVLPLGLTFLPAFVLTTIVPVVLALTGDVLG